MLQVKVLLGISDILNKTSEIFKITIEMVSETEWVVTEYESKINPNVLDVKSIIDTEIVLASGENGIRYMPEVNAVIAVQSTVSSSQYDVLYNQYTKQSLLDHMAGICYARSGMLTKALALWENTACNLSNGQLIQRILPERLRMNLLAETLYGNGGSESSILINRHFWGLSASDPRIIYNEGGFYIHAAGLKFQSREAALDNMNIGQQVVFELEPQNIHDPQAVHLWTEFGGDLGYVPSKIAATIAFNMRRGTAYQGKVACIRKSSVSYRRLAIWVQSVK